MQAIILCAGMGTRLGCSKTGIPKALTRVGATTLLERQLSMIDSIFPEVADISLVVGYRASTIRAAAGSGCRYITNPRYSSTNTAESLALAFAEDGQNALVVNGDVFADEVPFQVLIGAESAAVCEFKSDVDAEEVQVVLSSGTQKIAAIGKDIGGCAEAVGIYRFSEQLIGFYLDAYGPNQSQTYYEDVINRCLRLRRMDLMAISLGSGVAKEIDTPEDLAEARVSAA